MRTPSSLKQEFLKKWIMGLQICSSSKDMSILERKKAIKLSADVAMASTRNPMTCWSRAVIANASKDDDNKILVKQIMGSSPERPKKASIGTFHKKVRSEKIVRRSCSTIRRVRKSAPQMATSVAKRLMKKRTQVLKSLIPGGESMDQFSLIEEVLDYIVSLRTQVHVMRCVVNTTKLLNSK